MSSFVVSGRDGVPADPEGGLPSLMVDTRPAMGDKRGHLRSRDGKSVAAYHPQQRLDRAGKPWRQAALMHDCPKERAKTADSQRVR